MWVLYNHFYVTLSELSVLCHKWLVHIPELDEDDNIYQSDIWDFPFRQLVSLRDCLIQFTIVHQAHYTPHRVHKMVQNALPDCWRYSHPRGDYTKGFRSRLQPLYSSLLFGLVEELAPTVAEWTLLGLLLLYAR